MSIVLFYNLDQNKTSMKKIEFIIQLSVELLITLSVKGLATPTLRLKLRKNIENFCIPGVVPEEQKISGTSWQATKCLNKIFLLNKC